jgi:hypothetical protein
MLAGHNPLRVKAIITIAWQLANFWPGQNAWGVMTLRCPANSPHRYLPPACFPEPYMSCLSKPCS